MLSLSKLKSGNHCGAGFRTKSIVARGATALGAVVLSSFFAVAVQAFPALNLTAGNPDIISGLIDTDYTGDNNAGTLTATGQSFSLALPGGSSEAITGGTFNINSNLSFNSLSAVGTLSIGGTIPSLGFASTSLLTGTLSAFGAGAGDPLEFLFNITGGDAATLYGGIGAEAGVILGGTGYAGSFDGAFRGVNGLADTFGSVPVPGTLLLMLSGCGLLAMRRRQVGSAA